MTSNSHSTQAEHYIVDLHGVEERLLDNMVYCNKVVKDAIILVNCKILNNFNHQFNPQGLSINFILAESHLTLHSWPEYGYCAIDFYGCGNKNLKPAIDHLIEKFQPTNADVKMIRRGTYEVT